MNTLHFTNLNIRTAVHEKQRIVWDQDTNTFGVGWSLPEALEDLAENYSEEYRCDNEEERDEERRECGCPTYE
jgi:hypothetical protein